MFEASHRFVHHIDSILPLSKAERHALATVPLIGRNFAPQQGIVLEGDRPGHCCLIFEGWACRYRTLEQGERQILAFHIPGDLPDLHSLHLTVSDHSLAAITPITVGFVSHDQIHNLIKEYPRLGAAFWKDTLIDAAIYREWIVGMGRKEALPRFAHLLCELFMRMQAVGLTTQLSCRMPITQRDLGDALGLTSVHVNRVLRDLRDQDLVVLHRRTLTILNWAGLAAIAEFDPAYLHQASRTKANSV